MSRQIQVRKRDLTITLQRVKPHPDPKAALEQYTISADLAAEILFTACYVHDDIQNKHVLDLGTGPGRLALGASILGADFVVGVDVDGSSLDVARTSGRSIGARAEFVLGDIGSVRGPFDTVLMNPPFGTRKAHADLQFLECAVELADVVYSIHKTSTREFLDGWLKNRGFSRELIIATKMEIPHQFPFHRKPRRWVEVDAIRIERHPKRGTDA